MIDSASIENFKKGSKLWNQLRRDDSDWIPNLSDVDFESQLHSYQTQYDMPEFSGYDLSNMGLNRITARNSTFIDCDFSGSSMSFSDLCFSMFVNCRFDDTEIAVTKIGSAQFFGCSFKGSNLSYCSAEETSFSESTFLRAKLNNMSLVKNDFSNASIKKSWVYGISAWDLDLSGCEQSDIYINENGTGITVPSIELAQFISLLVNNSKVRDFIDTITSKMVLILGSFSPERKLFLDEIKASLEQMGYLPVLFDFDGPTNRDIGETVMSLASLSKFIIADITEPKSIPQELESIVPNFPSVPVQPIIQTADDEYSMFERFRRYPWVLEPIIYSRLNASLTVVETVKLCEAYLERTQKN